jgi:alpha/beta superfamily hydrolase
MSAEDSLTIDGPAGTIEARLERPEGTPRFRAVVCHPHSLYGGAMGNKVVTTLTRAVRQAGGVALRFNFRGVGESAGRYDAGIGETEDLLAVWDWLAGEYPDLPAWLAGFSFGSFVAARGAERLAEQDRSADGLALIAPPVHHYDFASLAPPECPVTVIQGDADEIVPVEEVRSWVGVTALAPEYLELPGVSHFFHGHLGELKSLVTPRLPG